MNYDKLKAELLAGHPVTGAYSDDAAIAATQLNAVNREEPVASVTGQEIFEAVTGTDFGVLSESQKALLYAIIGMGTILVNGTNTRAALLSMFGDGTETRTNLAEMQTRTVSRAQELDLGVVKVGYIERARN